MGREEGRAGRGGRGGIERRGGRAALIKHVRGKDSAACGNTWMNYGFTAARTSVPQWDLMSAGFRESAIR